MIEIPTGTELKYVNLTLNNVSLQNRFSAAITIVATAILQDSNSSSQLIKLAKNVANDSSAMQILVQQSIKFAISEGLIITSSATVLDNKDGTFDDNTVTDSSILGIVQGLAANSSLLTILGYEN
ncbi:MAG: hypothetical protein LW728_21835 [Microcystis sp. 49638_E5]|jgi:hypothetical protein|uniref:hypothetical protein n=1 Tax=Microcystis sp. 49638_E5 TaxID=2904986 RepID=UPI00258F23C1|nr:hypothetical protein [Microcystis sp. 49638_E5]MCE2671782.1 hypothetical protein [Microcystis sp. 49638_E5]